ncbi:lipase family protein [Echinicola strongylocentroti]|uniref:Lipase family protein n=1 Tax=Echinicola strongylocentroti TaxID=1795355 RepID=A0A2Z4IMV3_9BACT|nr:lipase family protein [Echinicola strongylocentroti]AWW31713.1 lipase family protein [Echinicola strongylocentroti]
MHWLLLILVLGTPAALTAQTLQPGFDKEEYLEMIRVGASQIDTLKSIDSPQKFERLYRSPEMGLKNRWELWIGDQTALLSIRGTTADPVSWLANFYAAMVPAKGSLQLSSDFTFDYELATDPKAAVHVGWLIGTAFLSRDILPKLDSLYQGGYKQLLITGHSQGGAISYLLTAHLRSLQKKKQFPADFVIKTYSSAAPKPGNLYFAYAYESATMGGWAYNVVSSEDWVPQTPISIQNMDDFATLNPFSTIKSSLKKQKFPKNIALQYAYGRLTKPTIKAQKRYQKHLGNMVAKQVKSVLPEFVPPQYVNSNHYSRTGNHIVLKADQEYQSIYPSNNEKVFTHHHFEPYYYLANQLPEMD